MDHENQVYLGIDIGSVSLDIAVLDKNGQRIYDDYKRTKGKPLVTLRDVLKELILKTSLAGVDNAVVTGSGRDVISRVLDIAAENEILAHAYGSFQFNPQVRTTIEIGGQDSKLILFAPTTQTAGLVIMDHAMNEICAAGTGSFLDQQAGRLNIPIEEFGDLALRSSHPASIAGRCAVFAKSDLIHLQQQGTPLEDIAAGLCYAMVRNYISNLCRGRELHKPIVFQGGVAANKGVVKAFCDLLDLDAADILIPDHYDVIGAVGAALLASERRKGARFLNLAALIQTLENYLDHYHYEKSYLPSLPEGKKIESALFLPIDSSKKTPVYLGVDIGAASTDIIAITGDKEIVGGVYLMTEGKPLAAVKKGLEELGKKIAASVDVKTVGITGSGRYMVGDFIGADIIKNEIVAQAKGIRTFYPEVDTIFEIGGQDSKYIRLKNGAIVDFEMNKVCAAGTGSFLAEQAEKLDIKINDEYSRKAFNAQFPANLGSRCTVFMESDIVHHQQQGCSKEDILAGLSYSIAKNFLEKVVFNRSIGERICFSGGVASNRSVVAAFENLLKKELVVLPYHKYTGAIGAAVIALENHNHQKSNFQGFDLSERQVRVTSFECKDCPNRCDVNKIAIDDLPPSFYGSICGKYDTKKVKLHREDLIDLFEEREKSLLTYWSENNPEQGPVIGIPRTLLYYALFPQWAAFFNTLGFRVILSDKTNKKLLQKGMRKILTETCYPIKAVFGHVVNLVEKGVETIFLPSYVDMEKKAGEKKSYNCPYVSGIPVFIRSALDIEPVAPAFDFENIDGSFKEQLLSCGLGLGKTKQEVKRAIKEAETAMARFRDWRLKRGQEVLAQLDQDELAVVLVGKPYNTCDPKLNMNIPKKLLDLGVTTIPLDFLPLGNISLAEDWDRLIWQSGRDILRAAEIIKKDERLVPLFITNFSCGPDAHTSQYFKELIGDRPSLILEIDEHFGDAGLVTRLEAFIDSLEEYKKQVLVKSPSGDVGKSESYPYTPRGREMRKTEKMLYIPYMSDHSYAFELAFKSNGLRAKVLPPPDDESLQLGRKYTSGVDCYPLVLMTGDLLKMQKDEEFDPENAALFFPGNDDPCRLSQYAYSWRRTLKQVGLEQVRIVSPITSLEKEQTSEVFGLKVSTTWWRASLAIDLLLKRKMEIRPYELNKGETDNVYNKALEKIKEGFLNGNYLEAISQAAAAMNAITTENRKERPIIGIMGADYYLRINPFSNNEIFREIEAMGCCVCLPPSFTDYMYLQAIKRPGITRHTEGFHKYIFNTLRGKVQFWEAKRIEKAFKPGLEYHSDPPIEEIMEYATFYADEKLEPCLLLNIGKAVDYARKGFSGIANLIPFCCLVGTIGTSTLKRIRADYNDIPVMSLIYDGLKQTNQKTRLEAFLHQAKLHWQNSRSKNS
jgi:predicted CoA-substrate-specific enzyme activase